MLRCIYFFRSQAPAKGIFAPEPLTGNSFRPDRSLSGGTIEASHGEEVKHISDRRFVEEVGSMMETGAYGGTIPSSSLSHGLLVPWQARRAKEFYLYGDASLASVAG